MNETRKERLNEIERRLKEAFNGISTQVFDDDTVVQIFVEPMYLKTKNVRNHEASRSISFKIRKEECIVEVHAFRAGYGLLKISFDKDVDSVNMCYATAVGAMKFFCEDAFDDCDYKSVADWFKGTSTNHVFQRIQDFAKDFLKK